MNTTTYHLSEKVRERMSRPKFRGAFDGGDASGRGLALNRVKSGPVTLTALFDPVSRVLYDARFFTYGAPLGVGILDAYVEEAKGKTLDQIASMTPESVEAALRDEPDVPSTDSQGRCHFDVVLEQCRALVANMPKALAEAEATRVAREVVEEKGAGLTAAEALGRRAEEFARLAKEDQLRRVGEVLDEFVRPGLAMDGGGLTLEDVKDGREVVVTYLGNCGSCGISSGSTLGYIENTLRSKLHDQIRVVPTNATTW